MSKQDRLNQSLHQMQSDIRLEVVLTELITEGISIDDIGVRSNGLYKRSYHRDIEKVEEIEYGISRKKKLNFFVNREGLYDKLPEDLFHQPLDPENHVDKSRTLLEMKAQEKLEDSSRLFFFPFEQEFYRLRVKLETEERKFIFKTNHELPGVLFSYLWDLPDFLNSLQKSKLGVIMPVLNQVAGNLAMTAFIMENISGKQINIREGAILQYVMTEAPTLGRAKLGADFILGGIVAETQSSVTIKIYLDTLEYLTEYMPGGKALKIIEFLSNLLIPFEKDVTYELDFSRTSGSFNIEKEAPYLGRLNYTTVI